MPKCDFNKVAKLIFFAKYVVIQTYFKYLNNIHEYDHIFPRNEWCNFFTNNLFAYIRRKYLST